MAKSTHSMFHVRVNCVFVSLSYNNEEVILSLKEEAEKEKRHRRFWPPLTWSTTVLGQSTVLGPSELVAVGHNSLADSANAIYFSGSSLANAPVCCTSSTPPSVVSNVLNGQLLQVEQRKYTPNGQDEQNYMPVWHWIILSALCSVS